MQSFKPQFLFAFQDNFSDLTPQHHGSHKIEVIQKKGCDLWHPQRRLRAAELRGWKSASSASGSWGGSPKSLRVFWVTHHGFGCRSQVTFCIGLATESSDRDL